MFLFVGFWLRWSQEDYRCEMEEAIKDDKISADLAGRRVEKRRLLGALSIIVSLLLFVLVLL
ncbi:MAG: hypothetical protein LW690_01245 [Opitutaceae bacterium]|nr:hypothetical protein [Opitutaceae bacterium]